MAAESKGDVPIGAPVPYKEGRVQTEEPVALLDEAAVKDTATDPAQNGTPRAATPARPKRLPRRPPPGVPIPQIGLPALHYKLNRSMGRPHRVPNPGKREQRLLQRQNAIKSLKALCDKVPSLTVCFVNVKGAAATTTTTVHTASVVGDQTRSTLVVSDFNPASGTSAVRLGRDFDQTITLRQLRRDLSTLDNFRAFIARVRPTRYSVRVVSADPIVDESQHLTNKNAKVMLEAIAANCEYHFIDTANDITNSVTLEVVKASDVIVFTANVAVHDSLRQLATSMETLRNHGFGDKVDNSVIVISNIPKGKKLDNYRRYQHRHNLSDEMVSQYPFHGQFLGVPHDPVIALDREVDLGKLGWATYQAYLELGIAIFEQAPRFRTSPSDAVV